MQKIKQALNKVSGTDSPRSQAEHGANGSALGSSGLVHQHADASCGACTTTGQTTTTTTTTVATAAVPVTAAAGDVPVARQGQQAVCSAEHFTKVEDRPIVKERVEYIQEHRPVEKEFVVETRATGVERELAEGRTVEVLGVTERVVAVTPPKPPCA